MIRMLIFDTDPLWIASFVATLQTHPDLEFTVVTATNTAEAQQHIEQSDTAFDIFVISQQLSSETDGITALQILHMSSPGTAAVVLFTIYDAETTRRAFQAGAHLYLPKSLDHAVFISILLSLYTRRLLHVQEQDWLRILTATADATQQSSSIDEVATATAHGGTQLGFERARLWLFDASTEMLIGRAQVGNRGLDTFVGWEMPLQESYYWHHMPDEREPRIFHSRNHGASHLDRTFGADNDKTAISTPDKLFTAPKGDWIIVPLWSGDRFLGVLSLDDVDALRAIIHDQLILLRIFGRLVVAAIDRVRESYARDWSKKLTAMDEEAQQKDTVQEVGEVVVRSAQTLGFERARLWQYNADQYMLVGLSQFGSDALVKFVGFPMPIEATYSQHIISNSEPKYFYGRQDPKGFLETEIPAFHPPQGEWASIALWSAGQCLGMLVLDNADQTRKLAVEQKEQLRSLSQHIVTMLERARLSSNLAQLTAMAERVQRARSVQNVADVLVSSAQELGFKRARLWRVIEEAGEKFIIGLRQKDNIGLKGFDTKPMQLDQSFYFREILAKKQREPIYYRGRGHGQAIVDRLSQDFVPPKGEWVDIPLWWSNDELIGTLTLDNDQETWSIPPHKRELLRLFGRQAAAALSRAQDAEESRRLKAAAMITKDVSQTLDLDQTVRDVLSKLKKLFSDSSLFILIYKEKEKEKEKKHRLDFTRASAEFYHITIDEEKKRKAVPLGNESMAGQLAFDSLLSSEVEIKNIGDVNKRDSGDPYMELILSTNSEICITLNMNGSLLGVLAIEHPDKNAFSEEDEELLLIIQPAISKAINRALKSERIREGIIWQPPPHTYERVLSQLGYAEPGPLRDTVKHEIEEVLLWLFWDLADDDGLNVKDHQFSLQNPSSTPQRESVLLRVWTGGAPSYYVKIGRSHRLLEEKNNYVTYLLEKFEPGFYATHERSKMLKHMSGVVYGFSGARRADLIDFSKYVKDTPATSISVALELFYESWSGHYQQATRKTDNICERVKSGDFKDSGIDGIQKKIKSGSLFWSYSAIWKTRWHERMRQLVYDPSVPWPTHQRIQNPILWLRKHVGVEPANGTDFSDETDFSAGQCVFAVTHGDMNGDGMFVDSKSGRIYVSNYKRTGYGPILQDFLELEVNLLVQLLPLASVGDQFAQLVSYVLSIPANPPENNMHFDHSNAEATKIGEVIYELRRRMYYHTFNHIKDETWYEKQTLWGLLFNAVNLATLLHERREEHEANLRCCQRALLLASLICQRIERLDDLGPEQRPPDLPKLSEQEREQKEEELKTTNNILSTSQRRLNILREQIALTGIGTDPLKLLEIENLETEIAKLKRQLGET